MPRVRPGRAERNALRSSGEWSSPDHTAPPPQANPSPLDAFMAFEDDTVPQPGAFDAPFALNAEESFALNFESGSVLGEFSEELAFEWENRFSEEVILPECPSFGGGEFADLVTSSACAAVAVRVLTHEGIEEWSSHLDDLEIALPEPLAEFVQSRGSTTPSDGMVLTMSHPNSFASSALRTGKYIQRGDHTSAQMNFWLPVCPDDPRTKNILSNRYVGLLEQEGVQVPLSEVKRQIFSGGGATWDVDKLSERAKHVTHALTQSSMALFLSHTKTPAGRRVLRYLDLGWHRPNDGDLVIQDTMAQAIDILERWKVLRPTLQRVTELSCAMVNFRSPGSPTQAIIIHSPSGRVTASLPPGVHPHQMDLEVVFKGNSSFDTSRGKRAVSDVRTRYDMLRGLVGQFF